MRLLIAIIFLFCSAAYAQDPENISFSGTIKNAEDSTTIPFVHIVNISKNKGTTSDALGRFSIKVSKSDTIHFSSVGFKLSRITFRDSTGHKYADVTVWLYPQIITLRPVEIRAYNLEEMFNKAREKEFTLEQDQPEPLFEPKEKTENPVIGIGVSPGGGASLEGAITAFANLFNRDFKQRKKLKEILEKEALDKEYAAAKRALEKNYEEIAKTITGLNNEEFPIFIQKYMPDLDFLLYADDYELAVRIYKDYRDYRYTYKLEEVSLEELMENAKFRK